MKRAIALSSIALLCLLALPTPAAAYIGPGLAGGALSAIIGSIGALAMLFAGAVWYPIRRAIRYLRKRDE